VAADIFINYRGTDANYVPSLLFARLRQQFGQRRVFLDAVSIAPGDDYVERLLHGVRSSKVLLAVIGPQWLAANSSGERLIDDPHDWIRRELVTAFEHGVTVIPVFTEDATPPRPDDLPADIAQLGRQQGLPLRRVRAADDMEAIVREVSRHVPARRNFLLGVAAAVVLIAAGATLPSLFTESDPQRSDPGTSPGPGTSSSLNTTTTTKPPEEPQVWWDGNLTLDGEAFRTGYTLDTSPPIGQPLGDIGLVCQLSCAANEIAGTAFAEWSKAGLPDHQQCVDLLNRNPGQRSLSVKQGTKGCFGTAERRVGRLEVDKISGPGKMTIGVRVWK
jgi:hypothetical protein